MPAMRLEGRVPAMHNKGRVRVGADADLTIFDPAMTLTSLPVVRSPEPASRLTRLDLARWLTHPNHPLTSRVAVNRLWEMLFGTGEPVGAEVPEISDCAQLAELANSSVQASAGSEWRIEKP